MKGRVSLQSFFDCFDELHPRIFFFAQTRKCLNNCLTLIFLLVLNDETVKVTFVYLTGKTQKLKRAKEEAQAEIRSYREEREKQFIDYQREVSKYFVKALAL